MSQKIIYRKAAQIKLIATDVDGVLTAGAVFIRDDHEEPFGKFNILDGYAIIMAKAVGIKTAVISGRKSLATEARCVKLGIDIAHTGIHDKFSCLQQITHELGISLDEVAYLGDDLIDLPVLTKVGLSCAPANAVIDVKKRVDMVSNLSGGNGVLRELVELIMRAQNKYDDFLSNFIK